jgi:hypothetical protein
MTTVPQPRPGLWARWVALLAEREPGTSLALFRIALGLCVLYSIGIVVLDGMAESLWLSPPRGFTTLGQRPVQYRVLEQLIPSLLPWFSWNDPAVLLRLVVGLTLTGGALMVVGLGGRVTALVTLQLYLGIVHSNPDAAGGYDWLLSNALWLVVLSRSTATLSLDCRLRTKRWTSDELVPAWPRYLAIYQILLVYGDTGAHKLSAAWLPTEGFSALYYILQEPVWTRYDLSWLAWVYPLTQAATALTWFWEITSPLLLLVLWYRRTADRPGRLRALCNRLPLRGLWVANGIAVHLGILFLMNVGPFSLIALSYYICLFRPEEWRRLRVPGASPKR